jgi:DNA-binding transcriptional MerR regulator
MAVKPRYDIRELAELGGVSRRTVRYYVQEGLLLPPLGVGRGRHYGQEHLDRLLRVKTLQEQGLPLNEIRGALSGRRAASEMRVTLHTPPRTPWTRIELAPGIELHVASEVRLPPPGKLMELAEWCHRHFRREKVEGDDA